MKFLRVLKEVFLSSLPLLAVIVIVCGFVAPLENPLDYAKLAVGYVCVIIGQVFFLVGLDVSILPIGRQVGESLVKLKKSFFVIFFGFVFGLLATVAEPALSVLATQTNLIMPIVNKQVFIWVMGAGIGVFVGFSLYRIIKNLNIKIVFAVMYVVVFILAIFVPEEFLALAFDGSGATTGDVSVPFILTLGVGVSVIMSKRKTNDDAFGIIGIASVGPIIALFIYGIVLKLQHGVLPQPGVYDPGAVQSFSAVLVDNLLNVAFALLPVIIMFIPFQLCFIRLQRRDFWRIILGTLPVYAGLLIFLSGIDFGFAFAGGYIGKVFLAATRPLWFKWLLLPVGFVLGAAITLSEPAVTVLGEQLEELSNGHIRKNTIRLTLAVGIGIAAVLCIVKILTCINILYFLVPLYAIALIMMKFTPTMFVSLAFDSGGVAGGALTSAFLTPLTLGIAQAVADTAGAGAQSVLVNGFGIIAFISVTPLIAVQALGIIYDNKLKQVQAQSAKEELIGLGSLIAGSSVAAKKSRLHRAVEVIKHNIAAKKYDKRQSKKTRTAKTVTDATVGAVQEVKSTVQKVNAVKVDTVNKQAPTEHNIQSPPVKAIQAATQAQTVTLIDDSPKKDIASQSVDSAKQASSSTPDPKPIDTAQPQPIDDNSNPQSILSAQVAEDTNIAVAPKDPEIKCNNTNPSEEVNNEQ